MLLRDGFNLLSLTPIKETEALFKAVSDCVITTLPGKNKTNSW
jgi:hypothetical protein